MSVNTSFKFENGHCNIGAENEHHISQYKENEYNDVAKVESHKNQCNENEYNDVLKVEQPNYAALQNEQQTQRCRVSLYKNLFIIKTVRKQKIAILIFRILIFRKSN